MVKLDIALTSQSKKAKQVDAETQENMIYQLKTGSSNINLHLYKEEKRMKNKMSTIKTIKKRRLKP
jgi:hypothetical protein